MKTPKISLGSWAFSFGPFASKPWPFFEVAEYAAKAGYDGIEINGFLPHPHPDEYNTTPKCKELLKRLDDMGLGISAYAPNFTAVPPNTCKPKEYLEVLKKYLFFCEECNIKLLRVDTVSPPEIKSIDLYKKQFETLVTNWRSAAEESKKSGTTIVWEFEPGFWMNKPSEVVSIVDHISHENFKLLFDTSHAYMGSIIGARHVGEKEILDGGLDEYAKMLIDKIGHIHLIDSNGQLHDDETSIHETFGKGYINFKSVINVLSPVIKNLEWVCVDYCFNLETLIAAKDAVGFVKDLLSEVYE